MKLLLGMSCAIVALLAGSANVPAQTPAAAPAPEAWLKIHRETLEQMIGGKTAEAIAALQKVVATYPSFGEGHSALASAHEIAAERLESEGASTAAARREHLQKAALHYQRGVDLTHVNRAMDLGSLAGIYGPGALAQPVEAERYARRALADYPSGRDSHAILAWALLSRGQTQAAAAALKNARSAVGADKQLEFAAALGELVRKVPAGSNTVAAALLSEMDAIAEAEIKATPARGEAYMVASIALDTRAQRLETDPARKAAMLDRAKTLWEQGREANRRAAGSSAAAAPPAPAAPAIPEKWYEDAGTARELANTGKPAEALKIYERYMTSNPSFADPVFAAAGVHESMGDAITGTSASATADRRRHFETAAGLYRKAASLAAPSDAMPPDFFSAVKLYRADRLNRPADGDALSREVVTRYPKDGASHAVRVWFLLGAGRGADVPAALAAARASVPGTADAQHLLGVHLFDLVFRDKALTGPAAAQVVAAASTALDASLQARPDSAESLVYKSLVLKLQAERFEPDPAKAKALLAAADKLRARATELMKRKAG